MVFDARAKILIALGRREDAHDAKLRAEWLKEWSRVRETLADAPADVAAWHKAGILALGSGERDLAKTCFERVSRSGERPYKALADAGIAKAHFELGEHRHAVAAATRAMGDRDAVLVAAVRGKAGSPATSRGWRALGDPLSVRAAARHALGDFDGAIADYESAQAFGPEVAEAYRQRAVARENAGDAAGADSDRERARELEPFDTVNGNP